MKVKFVAFGICALTTLLQGCSVSEALSGDAVGGMAANGSQRARARDDEAEAIRVAEKEMARLGVSGWRPETCELSSSWLFIDDESGWEVAVDKVTKRILRAQQIPVGTGAGGVRNMGIGVPTKVGNEPLIGIHAAIVQTNQDAREAYGSIDNFTTKVCPMRRAWRILYEVEKGGSGGGPDYVVDKATGIIIHRRYSQ